MSSYFAATSSLTTHERPFQEESEESDEEPEEEESEESDEEPLAPSSLLGTEGSNTSLAHCWARCLARSCSDSICRYSA